MIEIGTSSWVGITSGRATPGLVYVRWEPTWRANRNPTARKTFSSFCHGSGVSRGMDSNGYRKLMLFESNEIRTDPTISLTLIAAVLEDLF